MTSFTNTVDSRTVSYRVSEERYNAWNSTKPLNVEVEIAHDRDCDLIYYQQCGGGRRILRRIIEDI